MRVVAVQSGTAGPHKVGVLAVGLVDDPADGPVARADLADLADRRAVMSAHPTAIGRAAASDPMVPVPAVNDLPDDRMVNGLPADDRLTAAGVAADRLVEAARADGHPAGVVDGHPAEADDHLADGNAYHLVINRADAPSIRPIFV